MSSPKIEAILPLTFGQQALLFHSLQAEEDQGFLQVVCTIEGEVDLDKFQDAWDQTVRRHGALRTSVHWLDIEKPVQMIHAQKELPWITHDWSSENASTHDARLNELRNEDRNEGFALSNAPITRVNFIKLDATKSTLLWSCHHLLLDGWSAAVILTDVLFYYDATYHDKTSAELPPLPSYKTYRERIKSGDENEAAVFWKELLRNPPKKQHFLDGQLSPVDQGSKFVEERMLLTPQQTNEVVGLAKESQVTISVLLHGIWATLMCKYFSTTDILIGSTVSGRSLDLPEIDLMAGMFMNVLPIRFNVEGELSFSEHLKSLHRQQVRASKFEHCTLDQIASWTGHQDSPDLLNSLVVFENYPLEDLKGGNIALTNCSGGLTTTYPLTFVIKPGHQLEFIFKYNQALISHETITWVSENLLNLVAYLKAPVGNSFLDVLTLPPTKPVDEMRANETISGFQQHTNEVEYMAPGNSSELRMTRIWEEVLQRQPIGVTDDFFDIGGKSILVMRLFSKIEEEFGSKLAPVTILKHSTVRALTRLIQEGGGEENWSSLVPLRTRGSKPPIFCIHAGGGHVFFYQPLAQELGADQPVYALQSLGMDDIEACHQSIEDMADHYLDEIIKVQPTGPYTLIGTCFSNPVCIEIANRMIGLGHKIALLAIIDSPPNHLVKRATPTLTERGITFGKMIKDGHWQEIFGKLNWYFVHPFRKKLERTLLNESERRFDQLRDILHEVAIKYIWKPYNGRITLIRTTEFHNDKTLDQHVKDWEQIAKGGLDVFVVEAHHRTMFEGHEVKNLATQIVDCLQDSLVKEERN